MQVVVRILKERPKALRVTDGEWVAWVPRSVISRDGWDFDLAEMPLHIAEEKGLFTAWNWQPVESTKQATLWLVRNFGYASRRLDAWLERHEPQLRVWLRRQEKSNRRQRKARK
jgi:hypothetical protein